MRRSKKPSLEAKSAWVITWDGTSGIPADHVAAILNYRASARSVKDFTELLYLTLTGSPAEKLRYAKSAKGTPYPAEMTVFQKITCGHNPHLYARLVTDLKVVDGTLTWKEPLSDTERRKTLEGR